MDRAHKNAHGRHAEVGARELEPLRPREPRLDPARHDPWKGHPHQPLVLTPREHEQRTLRKTRIFQPLVQRLQRPQIRRYSPYRVIARNAHTWPSLPTSRPEIATAFTNGDDLPNGPEMLLYASLVTRTAARASIITPEPRCIQSLAGAVSRLWSAEAPKPTMRNHTHEAATTPQANSMRFSALWAAMAPPRIPTVSRTAWGLNRETPTVWAIMAKGLAALFTPSASSGGARKASIPKVARKVMPTRSMGVLPSA